MTEIIAESVAAFQVKEEDDSPVDQMAWLKAGWPQEQLDSIESIVADAMVMSLVPLVSISFELNSSKVNASPNKLD